MTIRMILPALSKRARSLIYTGAVLLFAFCFHSCDEELPVYIEPSARLDAKIDGEYFLSDLEHSLRVYIRITNLYEETLVGPASLIGSIKLFFPRDTTVHKTLLLSRANLVTENIITNGTLKIDPKQTIILRATWDFSGNIVVDDRGRNLVGNDSTPGFFSYVPDPTCQYRQFARPEDLVLQGSVTVFSQRAPVEAGPSLFRFCFVTNFVNVVLCARIVTVVPCSNWP